MAADRRERGGRRTWTTVVLPALVLAAAALVLQWLDHRHALRTIATETYILLLAVGFTALGTWAGARLTRRRAASEFDLNTAALRELGITEREHEVLRSLARGLSNAQIAEHLFVSPNTVKTHLARLYAKLGVTRRTQAVHEARALRLIP